MRVFLFVLPFILATLFVSFRTEAENLPTPSLDDLLQGPTFWSPELSPSGRYLAGVRRVEDDSILMVVDLDDPESDPQYELVGDLFINWVEWATDDRMLVSLTGFINQRTGRQMTREDLKNATDYQYPAPFTRILSMNRDYSDAVVLFDDNRLMNKNFGLGRIVSLLEDDPDHVLMAAWAEGDLDLFRMNIMDGSSKLVTRGMRATYRWFADRNGEPAIRLNINKRRTVIYVYARSGIKNGKYSWRKIRSIRLKRDGRDDPLMEFRFLVPGPSAATYYVSYRPEGSDKRGIHLYDFEKNEFVQTVFSSEDYDVGNAYFDAKTFAMLAAIYYSDRLEVNFVDPVQQAHMDALQAYFGDQLNVNPIDATDDGMRWLVRVYGPHNPGDYYIYFLEDSSFRYLGGSAVQLTDKALAKTQIVRYAARDGLEISGYLTQPPGLAPGAKPPLILMPHGGPEARDTNRFNPMTQALVAAGYQVFQPNFRGSSGYGQTFADLGRHQWGKDMQTDLDDGFAHLIEQEIADPARACIVGASYGGYAAMAAATLTPDLYQCSVAIAGLSDLTAMLRWVRQEDGRDSRSYEYWTEHIGDPSTDRVDIEAVSPAKMADRVTHPILLIHGEDDNIVPIKQTELMEKALKKAGKSYQKLVLENSAHSYRSDADERLEYETILDFLNTHLPAKPVRDAPAEVLP